MTDRENFVTVRLNGFLLNAGVVGLLKMFDYAGVYDEKGCCKDEDYVIDGQNLYIRRDFLLTHDLADLYIKSMVFYLRDDTSFIKTLSRKDEIITKFTEYSPENKTLTEYITKAFKEFSDMLEKNSFKAGYVILESYTDIKTPNEEMVSKFKKEKNLLIKKDSYVEICSLLEQPKVQEVLIFKELMYSKINLFMENFAFYLPKNLRSDIIKCYRDDFIIPFEEMLISEKPKKKRCIDCGEIVLDTTSISFMNDMTDDVNRKKSYYWNNNPDAFLCPLCAFIYSFIPIGFSYIGRDAVFINNNSDIDALRGIMAALESNDSDDDKKLSWFKLYNLFTSEKISQLFNRINNIQVIFREKIKSNNKDSTSYRMSTIDKRVISILRESQRDLNFLQNRYVKNENESIYVYQETIETIIRRKSLYPFITKLFRLALKENNQTDYLFSILKIEMISKGEEHMTETIKRVYAAKKIGESMRATLTADVQTDKDRDNKLRGLVYQLLNAVSSGNRDNFLNLLIRTYSSYGKPVPDIFLACFNSDEDFREIGYAYLLGLKSDGNQEKKQKENVKNEQE